MTRRSRILVIDDEPMFRNLMMTVLRKDYLVSVACEGKDGYYKALEHTPDIAVVDVQMPGWDGLTTLKNFRESPSLSKVPIIMLTSDASKETVLAAINGGAVDYIIKTTFSKEEFLHKLERHLPRRMANTVAHIDNPASIPTRPAAESSDSLPLRAKESVSRPAAAHQPATLVSQPQGRVQAMIDDWE